MSAPSTNHSAQLNTGLLGWLSSLLSRMGQNMVQAMEAHARLDQVTALQNKSDEDLAKLGITRTEIPAYVFRDKVWI